MTLNLPNLLSFARIIIVPMMFWLLVERDSTLLSGIHPSWLDFFAAFLFVLAAITDFFDGYIARLFNQHTTFGAIIDPLADKLLMLGGFLGLMLLDRADPWAILLILGREFFITGLRIVAVSEGKDVSASMLGKIKTVLQILAVGFLIIGWPGGTLLLWLAVAATLYSGMEYVRDYVKQPKGA